MAEMLEVRKKMFGIHPKLNFGFHKEQRFVDLTSNKIIRLLSEFSPEQNIAQKEFLQFPERLEMENPYLLYVFADFTTKYKQRHRKVKQIQFYPIQKRRIDILREQRELGKELKKKGYL